MMSEIFKPALTDENGNPIPDALLKYDETAVNSKPGYNPDVEAVRGPPEAGGGSYKAPQRCELPVYYQNNRVKYAKFIREFIYPANEQLCYDWLILYKNGTIDARRLSPYERPKGRYSRTDAWLGGDFMNWKPTDEELQLFMRDALCNRLYPSPRWIEPPNGDMDDLPELLPFNADGSIKITRTCAVQQFGEEEVNRRWPKQEVV
jgi:hypothetical protein